MIAAPQHGFVFLAVPKCASTSVQAALRPHAALVGDGDWPFKHTTYGMFERHIEPFLAEAGFDRSSYEVVCLIRDPISWLESWWRFRSRPELADPACRRHPYFTGDTSFEEFAQSYIAGREKFAGVGGQWDFIVAQDGTCGPDRVFRYEEIDGFRRYLSEKTRVELELRRLHVSPTREPGRLDPGTEAELRACLRREYEVYASTTGCLG